MGAYVEDGRQLRGTTAEEKADVHCLPLQHGKILQKHRILPQPFLLQQCVLRALAERQILLRRQFFPAAEILPPQQIRRNRKQPAIRTLRILQLFEAYPGPAESLLGGIFRSVPAACALRTVPDKGVSQGNDLLFVKGEPLLR